MITSKSLSLREIADATKQASAPPADPLGLQQCTPGQACPPPHPPSCTNMNCADQYYHGEIPSICAIPGVDCGSLPWDEFGMMGIPVVLDTGTFIPGTSGFPGETINDTIWSTYWELLGGGGLDVVGVNATPGYMLYPTVGDAFTTFGGQFISTVETFAKQVPWAGSINVSIPPPEGPGGFVFPTAYVPATKAGCVGGGFWVGTPSERSVGGGPLLFGTLGNARNVLSGWSWSFNLQVTPAIGFQVIWNGNGILAGPTAGIVPGVGMARTWSKRVAQSCSVTLRFVDYK